MGAAGSRESSFSFVRMADLVDPESSIRKPKQADQLNRPTPRVPDAARSKGRSEMKTIKRRERKESSEKSVWGSTVETRSGKEMGEKKALYGLVLDRGIVNGLPVLGSSISRLLFLLPFGTYLSM